ncbi:MAG TPA: hypothetical protein VMU39_17795 [Solirubrobacteraceae bacterium]|nr:hypothetical protein [Solirubrobacteraceae bacterium]
MASIARNRTLELSIAASVRISAGVEASRELGIVPGVRIAEVAFGFGETFDPTGVLSLPPSLPRAGSRYQQLGRAVGEIANYGPEAWMLLQRLFR